MYDKKVREYKAKQFDITQQIQEHSKADENHYLIASRLLDICKRATEIFNGCSEPNEKRQFLNFLLQNCRLRGKEPMFTLKPVFASIVSAYKNASWLNTVNNVRTIFMKTDGVVYIPDLRNFNYSHQ